MRRIAQRRDRGAFEELYELYYPRLFGYLLKMTRRPEMVEGLVNDVMLVVWRRAHRFDPQARPSSWIFGIGHRKALKALKAPSRLRRRSGSAPSEAGEEAANEKAVAGRKADPACRLERRQRAELLDAALGRLSPEQRAVVELTYLHGYSYREIAAIVGCPVNTVKTRMFHARRRLETVLPTLGISGPNLSHGG